MRHRAERAALHRQHVGNRGTLGGWWRFLKGDYGTMQTGVQYAYVQRTAFGGIGGSPKTDENILMFSYRYLPFQ